MKKKLLSVLLVVCMVLTLMPMAAFADTIEEVAVTINTTGLKAGNALPQAGTETAGATVSTAWVDENGNSVTGTFPSAGTYTAKITVTAENAGDITDDTTYTLNGSNATLTGGVLTATATVAEADPVTYTVSGTVSAGETGADVVGITVTLYKFNGTTSTATDKTATTTTGGAFSFAEVAAGDYEVVVAASDGNYAKSTSGKFAVAANKADVTVTLAAEEGPVTPPAPSKTPTINKTSVSVEEGCDNDTVIVKTDGAVTATSDDSEVVGVEVKDAEAAAAEGITLGENETLIHLAAMAPGTAKVTVSAAAGTTYEAKDFEVAVTVTAAPIKASVTDSSVDLGSSKHTTDIQSGVEVVRDGKTITVTGTSKYVTGYTGFSSVEEQQYGNYIAIDLDPGDGRAVEVTSPTEKNLKKYILTDDPTWLVNLKNFSGKATIRAGVAVIDDDTGRVTGITSATSYTVDFSKVMREAMVISDVENADDGPDAIDVKYANKKIVMAGAVSFDAEATEAEVDLTVTLGDGSETSVTAVIKNNNGTLTVANVDVFDASIAVDASGLYIQSDSEAVAATGDPDVAEMEYPADATAGEKTQIDAVNTAVKTMDSSAVDLDNIADKVANDESMTKGEALLSNEIQEIGNDVTATDISKISDAIAEMEKPEAERSDEKLAAVELAVQVYVLVEVKDVDTESTDDSTATTKAITLGITPKAQKVITTDPSDIKLLSEDNKATDANAVAVGEPEDVSVTAPTEVTVKLPADFVDGVTTVYIKHKKSASEVYYYESTSVNADGTVVFTSQHGFSDFEFTTETDCEAKIDGTLYKTLGDALKAVKEGENITLLKALEDVAAATMTGASKNFTITLIPADSSVEASDIEGKISGVTATGSSGDFTITYTKPTSNNNNGGSSAAGTTTTVTVSKASGGTVSVNDTSAKKGATVTITAKPDEGNEVGTVTVTDKDGNKLDVTDIGNNKYTFVMPDGKVTIKVTFVNKETGEVIPGPSVDFTDVAEGTYYYDAVAWAVEFGITNGIGENIFGPNSSCTRAQMVTFLWRLAGEPEASGTNPFADVAEDSYYYNAVLWAVSNGITNGTGENTFSPDATVTRGQSVTFLYRYAGQPTGAESSSFVDVAADAYYAAAVDWAAANGVTNGNGVDTFGPNDACTRAQIVTFMYRYAG